MMGTRFFGDKVVAAAFVMAVFGWGIGFYGPPIFMYTVMQNHGWSLALCSAAVTVHFLAGTLVVVNLPALYERAGLPCTTFVGVVVLCAGVYGWAIAHEPYQLFIAATLSGFGWVTMGAAAVNAVVSPWFVSKRPAALARAYNGASIGGVIFSSAWVYLIDAFGFTTAATGMAMLSVLVISTLSFTVFRVRPEELGQYPDGAPHEPVETPLQSLGAGRALKGNRQLITLAAAMALGLFAQIGLVSQLFLMLTQHANEQTAGIAMGLATASAMAGRYAATWLIGQALDRRTVACLSYGCQVAGCLSLLGLAEYPALLWTGMILFGVGIGNATSLPPLIAQAEFPRRQVHRVVTLIVAAAQGCYAFAPVVFGALKDLLGSACGEMFMLLAAGCIQALALVALNVGRKPGCR